MSLNGVLGSAVKAGAAGVSSGHVGERAGWVPWLGTVAYQSTPGAPQRLMDGGRITSESKRRKDFVCASTIFARLSLSEETREQRSGRAAERLGSFMMDAYNDCDEERLFLTEKGYIGCAGPEAREGDAVCVLAGAQVPFVLRTEGEQNLLVASAYVHGMMREEATKNDKGIGLAMNDL